jgi:hypothetical protein
MITRTDILAHLERGMRVGFLNGQKTYTPMRSAFVRETTSDGAFETYADMGAVPWPALVSGQAGAGGTDGRTGAAVVGAVHEGGPITILGGNERALIVHNVGYDIPIGITHDAINDARVGSLEQWARSAGARFEQHKDFLCFDALNNGEATTYYGAGYDKLPLLSASHVDPGGQYTTVQSNALSTALSYANFKAAMIAAGKFVDDRGKPTGNVYNLLIYALDLVDEAAQILTNPEKSGTTDRDKNPFSGKLSGLMAPGGWLDTTAWYLVAAGMPEKPINLQVRQQPQLFFWDDHTQGGGVRYYKWYARHVPFAGDWRLIIQGKS